MNYSTRLLADLLSNFPPANLKVSKEVWPVIIHSLEQQQHYIIEQNLPKGLEERKLEDKRED